MTNNVLNPTELAARRSGPLQEVLTMSAPAKPSPKSQARLQVSLTASGWAACIGVWFLAMAGIAIFGGERPLALAALMALFAGGLVVLVVLRLTGRNEPPG
jgi:hypothetical protein